MSRLSSLGTVMDNHCFCDPHGDNATCDRPCARTAEERRLEAKAIVAAARRARLEKESKE